MDLARRTRETYNIAVQHYKGYMECRDKDPRSPTVKDLCFWIAEESLFIKPDSLCKYVAGVKYYLDTYNKGHLARDVLVS